MVHRLAPEAEIELDHIWYRAARESGSAEIADRITDAIADRLFMLAAYPHVGRTRDEDLRPGLRSFPVGPRSRFPLVLADRALEPQQTVHEIIV
jgi:plasmid stabilization system protein ParE